MISLADFERKNHPHPVEHHGKRLRKLIRNMMPFATTRPPTPESCELNPAISATALAFPIVRAALVPVDKGRRALTRRHR